MNLTIDTALNAMYQRQITAREQLLNEMLRVKLTAAKLPDTLDLEKDKEKIFQLMKQSTEDELGFFPADRADFLEIFALLKNIDLIEFTLEIFQNDRLGTILSPLYVTEYISKQLTINNPEKILITEAEKHLAGLREMLGKFPRAQVTLTTQLHLMYVLLKLTFGHLPNVRILLVSIYEECLAGETFDHIFSLPAFGSKVENWSDSFITRDGDGIAMENMLRHLDQGGQLSIILPAKITFAGAEYVNLRSWINANYNMKSIYILPEGTFRPATAIKTYVITLLADTVKTVEIGTLQVKADVLCPVGAKVMSIGDFAAHEDWRIEVLLADDDENLQRFKASQKEKVKLKDVAEVFRGKSILKKDIAMGNIAVLNLSNIEQGEIDYSSMDTIAEDERKIKRYELCQEDVVLSCRGTAIKSAVFDEQEQTVIASANVIAIRAKEKICGEYIHIFLESPVGVAMIKSFQRGTTIMNINHSDIMEMEIPIVSIEEQKKIIEIYRQERKRYKEAIRQAEKRWQGITTDLYEKFI